MPIHTYHCPNCGAPLSSNFDSEASSSTCAFCLSTIYIKQDDKPLQDESDQTVVVITSETQDDDLLVPEEEALEEPLYMYCCPECDFHMLLTDKESSSFCFSCSKNLIFEGLAEAEQIPHRLIPFSLSKEEAITAIQKELKKIPSLESDFFSNNHLQTIKAVYFPNWEMNFQMNSEVISINKKKQKFKYTGQILFRNLFKSSPNLKQNIRIFCDSVKPFNRDAVQPISIEMLENHQTLMDNLTTKDLRASILPELTDSASKLVKAKLFPKKGEKLLSDTVSLSKESYVQTLLPVWVLCEKDTSYFISVNGQTGKVSGCYPAKPFSKGIRFVLTSVLTFSTVLFVLYFWRIIL
ncbi:hypothetical protein [Enterococcus sp. LJL51]|uniref:hypothetical protein n=1 Tax=Enterococcus sp. LJL51 TaxID=3416656 RepID=UPI003CF5FFC3